ncbi:MAG: TonB-dependent receptor [Proteobacteria bacterium]|nr:TonB-dependent receptor [Pseudomonadota bacterium]
MRFLSKFIIASLVAIASPIAMAEDDIIKRLSIDIEDLEVVTTTKTPEDPFKVAASVYTLTSDDIRRSGATNIPEALRLVPGMEVARSDSNKWAVTTRGFNRLYDNKILVLIDGREIYSSIFTGVNWDVTDIVLEDIDRIEVTRGPTSSVWGSNTLNGTINIITKDSRHTQGNYASVLYGNSEQIAEYRHGNHVGEDLYYRAYIKTLKRDSVISIDNIRTVPGTKAGDDWNLSKGGFRIDLDASVYDSFTFSGDVHKANIDSQFYVPTITEAFSDTEDASGLNLSATWNRELEDDSQLTLSVYYDHTDRESLVENLSRDVFNIDFQHAWQASKRHDVTWGLGFRYAYDINNTTTVNGILINEYSPSKQYNKLYSAFIQDKITLIPDTLDLTIGSKFEHNSYTGYQSQPSGRLSWAINDRNTVWASVSKAVRVPSKLEESLTRLATNAGPFTIYQMGNEDFKAEEMISNEIGYRAKIGRTARFDISAFYNRYDNIRTFEATSDPFTFKLFNKAQAEIHGFNTDFEFDVNANWNLGLGYSYTDIDMYFDDDSTDTISKFDAGVTPLHQLQLRSKLNLPNNIEFDTYIYYVDSLESVNIPSYVRTDMRIGWKPLGTDDLEFSINGNNLFNDLHRETTRSFYSTHNEVGREFYGRMLWRF